MLSKFISVLEKCQNEYTQMLPYMNVGENSVYLLNLLESLSTNTISEERCWGVVGGKRVLALKTI